MTSTRFITQYILINDQNLYNLNNNFFLGESFRPGIASRFILYIFKPTQKKQE